MTRMLLSKRLIELCVAILVIINIYQIVIFIKIRKDTGLYSANTTFPVPEGYLINSSYMLPRAAPCFLIRVTADGCPFCRVDKNQYEQLVAQAKKKTCGAVVVAPQVGEVKPDAASGVPQIQYVNMRFGRVLNPFTTPETILLNSQGRIIWDREGAMDKAALGDALRALNKLHE